MEFNGRVFISDSGQLSSGQLSIATSGIPSVVTVATDERHGQNETWTLNKEMKLE